MDLRKASIFDMTKDIKDHHMHDETEHLVVTVRCYF